MANEYEKLIELNKRGRCIKCKRREDEMITCDRCMEFKYCSKKCLKDDRNAHEILCDFIGVKKGLLIYLTEEQAQVEKKIIEKAIYLNDDGSFKIMEETLKSEQDENGSVYSQVQDRKPKKGKKKNKHSNGKNAGQNKNGNRTKEDLHLKKNKEKSVEALIAGGRFGQVAKFGLKEDSGKNFGAGWWKSKSKPETAQAEGCSETANLGATNTKIERKFKDFYSDSEDDETEKKNDSKETSQEDKSQTPSSTFKSATDEPVESAQSGMELVKFDPEKAEEEEAARNPRSQGRSATEKCVYCKMEGVMLKCSRCKVATYCNRGCQIAHYQQHKDICRMKEKYDVAVTKIPPLLYAVLRVMRRPLVVSIDLGDVLPLAAMMFHSNTAILVYILEEHPHPFLYGAIVRDMRGQVTEVLFCTRTDIYSHTVSNLFCPIIPIPLSMCIRPGNFILLLNPHWNFFMDGIRVEDMDDVHFVFMDD